MFMKPMEPTPWRSIVRKISHANGVEVSVVSMPTARANPFRSRATTQLAPARPFSWARVEERLAHLVPPPVPEVGEVVETENQLFPSGAILNIMILGALDN